LSGPQFAQLEIGLEFRLYPSRTRFGVIVCLRIINL
jgi:hypothetical protein